VENWVEHQCIPEIGIILGEASGDNGEGVSSGPYTWVFIGFHLPREKEDRIGESQSFRDELYLFRMKSAPSGNRTHDPDCLQGRLDWR
jgi:hypothetical protein